MAFVSWKKCFSEPKQLIKLMVLVVCCCFTISQLTQCVQKLMHPPVSTYYKFHLNKTMKYPSVTVCRNKGYKSYLFEKYGLKSSTDISSSTAFTTFKFDQYTVEEFFKDTTYQVNEVFGIRSYNGDGFGLGLIITSNYYLKYGLCHTVTPTVESEKFSIAGGYFFYLYHNNKVKKLDAFGVSETGFHIYFHDANEVLSEMAGQADSFLHYMYLESAEEMRLVLTVQTYEQISTRDEPCNSDPNYSKSKCLEECYNKHVAETVNCTLPFLNFVDQSKYEQCSNYPAIRELVTVFLTPREAYLRNCSCQISCKISVYNTKILYRRDVQFHPNSILSLYYSSNLITQMTEILSYDWNLFLSDIGGSMGFLLGLSVLGFVAALEEIFLLVIPKMIKGKQKKNNDEDDQNNTIQEEIGDEISEKERESLELEKQIKY